MVKTGKPSGAASDFYDSLEPVKLIRAASKEGKRQESPELLNGSFCLKLCNTSRVVAYWEEGGGFNFSANLL